MSEFEIEGLWAYIGQHDDGEGLLAAAIDGRVVPLIAADLARVEQLRPYAQEAANQSGVAVRLVRFGVRTECDVIEPDTPTATVHPFTRTASFPGPRPRKRSGA